jgi:hypothetical protein
MPDVRKIVKVFLASPGDLAAERTAAKAVVDEFNAIWAEASGYQIELVGWEDTVSIYGRPQPIINLELEKCELFIGMLWRRWGTPPDNEGHHTSGFEEEFKLAGRRRETLGRPEMSLFFKEIDQDMLRDPGDDLKKVLTFKQDIIAKKKILYQTFSNTNDFESLLRQSLSKYIIRLQAEDAKAISQGTQAAADTSSPAPVDGPEATRSSFLGKEGYTFLCEFLSKAESGAQQGDLTSLEIARFRVLANSVTRPGNNESSVGVHDANIIFTN